MVLKNRWRFGKIIIIAIQWIESTRVSFLSVNFSLTNDVTVLALERIGRGIRAADPFPGIDVPNGNRNAMATVPFRQYRASVRKMSPWRELRGAKRVCSPAH